MNKTLWPRKIKWAIRRKMNFVVCADCLVVGVVHSGLGFRREKHNPYTIFKQGGLQENHLIIDGDVRRTSRQCRHNLSGPSGWGGGGGGTGSCPTTCFRINGVEPPKGCVRTMSVNWRKSNQQMHWNCVFSQKFIYFFIAPTCFGYSLAITRVLVIWYNIGEQCAYFQDTVIYISVLQFQFTVCYNYK